MRKFIHLLVFSFLVLGVQAQDLLRGPYQQNATTNSIKIMWRTSEPTIGWVKIGDTPDNLDKVFTESSSVVDHNVLVTGLTPYTRYYYAIGYGDVTLSTGEDHRILTNKEYGDTTGVRFWVIGDAGKANQPQMMARDAFLNHTKDNPVDFMLMLGDNAYQNGEDKEYQQKVFESEFAYKNILKYLHYYTTPGNHDYNILRAESLLDYLDPTIDKGPYYDIHELPKNGEAGGVPSGTEIYYSFDYGHVHFIVLNSETFTWTTGASSPMKNWLKKDIAANKQPWTVAIFHQPPYSTGSHNSDDFYEFMMGNMRKYIIPILEEAGVDLVLSGHSHVYERSYLVNGHYGKMWQFDPNVNVLDGRSGNPDLGETYVKQPGGIGTVYSVVGNSGSYTSEGDYPTKLHPVFYTRDAGANVTGSIVVDVKGSTLTVEYINRFGDVLDKYSIFKQVQATPTDVKENYSQLYEMNAFPNPSSDQVTLNFFNPSLSKAKLSVIDLSGKQVLYQESTANGSTSLKVEGWKQLPTGSYVLSLDIDGRIGSTTVVKAK